MKVVYWLLWKLGGGAQFARAEFKCRYFNNGYRYDSKVSMHKYTPTNISSPVYTSIVRLTIIRKVTSTLVIAISNALIIINWFKRLRNPIGLDIYFNHNVSLQKNRVKHETQTKWFKSKILDPIKSRDKLFKKAIQAIQYPQWLDSRKTCQKYSQGLNQIC